MKGERHMIERIATIGGIAFITLFVFGIIFVIIDEKRGREISAKLQQKRWPTVVVFIWAAVALMGVGIRIFSGGLL